MPTHPHRTTAPPTVPSATGPPCPAIGRSPLFPAGSAYCSDPSAPVPPACTPPVPPAAAPAPGPPAPPNNGHRPAAPPPGHSLSHTRRSVTPPAPWCPPWPPRPGPHTAWRSAGTPRPPPGRRKMPPAPRFGHTVPGADPRNRNRTHPAAWPPHCPDRPVPPPHPPTADSPSPAPPVCAPCSPSPGPPVWPPLPPQRRRPAAPPLSVRTADCPTSRHPRCRPPSSACSFFDSPVPPPSFSCRKHRPRPADTPACSARSAAASPRCPGSRRPPWYKSMPSLLPPFPHVTRRQAYTPLSPACTCCHVPGSSGASAVAVRRTLPTGNSFSSTATPFSFRLPDTATSP